MAIHITWYDDKYTIIVQQFEGAWTLEEYYRFIDDMVIRLNSVSHDVHIIAEGARTTAYPNDLLAAFRYSAKHIPANEGIVVFVQPTALLKAFIKLLVRMNQSKQREYYFADTVEAAAYIINANTSSSTH